MKLKVKLPRRNSGDKADDKKRRVFGDRSRDFFRRFGWGLIAAFFLVSFVASSILALIANHQSNSTADNPSASALSCTFDPSVSSPALAKPAIYKPEQKITQLITSDLVAGNGPAAKSGDCITVKYFGQLTNGKVFDQDFTTSTALEFPLGQGEVIPGWETGIPGMKVGGVRRLLIPSAEAYGSQAQGDIPANSPLVFTVKLISIK